MIKAFACIDSIGLHPNHLSVTLHPMKEPRDGQRRWKRYTSGNCGTPAAPGRTSGATQHCGPINSTSTSLLGFTSVFPPLNPRSYTYRNEASLDGHGLARAETLRAEQHSGYTIEEELHNFNFHRAPGLALTSSLLLS